MRALVLASILSLSSPALCADAGQRWLQHVKVLADDSMEGRLTGTPGYDRAAAYVAGEFERLGLKPAGPGGYLQPVALKEQTVDPARSSLVLKSAKGSRPLAMADELLLGARVPQPGAVDAPLVFLGYGLHLPENGHDDLAGFDLTGKMVVVLAGAPSRLSGSLTAHAGRAEFWSAMQRAGAVGVINLANPRSMGIPWAQQKLFAATPGMRLAEPALNDATQPFLTATINPAVADILFEASGHRLAELLALADAGTVLPRFELNQRLQGQVVATDRDLASANIVALLPGRDRRLKDEVVVLSAHLDHLGMGQPVNGDRIYNGAMDNASGIASLLETARALKAARLRRSVLFVAVTGEERGLLGSRYFVSRPTVPARSMIANINMDMYLPLWPFTHVTAIGAEESTLGSVSAAAAKSLGIVEVPDRQPEQNLFVRSDQYSFVRAGVPALALKFAASTPAQEALGKAWLTDRYHTPADDLGQPIEPAYAVAFNTYLVKLIRNVADAPGRPTWKLDSFFRRFVPDSEPES